MGVAKRHAQRNFQELLGVGRYAQNGEIMRVIGIRMVEGGLAKLEPIRDVASFWDRVKKKKNYENHVKTYSQNLIANRVLNNY